MTSANGLRPTRRGSARGFGVEPEANAYHFVVKLHGDQSATIFERFPVLAEDQPSHLDAAEIAKAHVTAYRWARIVEPVTQEFNNRLRAEEKRAGRWLARETPLLPYLGKELTLLAWAIEDADATLLPIMIANWRGLAPEERWWFYTTINATAGTPDHGQHRGWRQAIKIAFTENPIELPPSALLVGPREIPAASSRRKSKPPPKPPNDNTQGMLRLFDD